MALADRLPAKTRRRLAKTLVAAAATTPAGLLAFRFVTDDLGANPIAELMNRLGYWTLVLLMASLVATPLRLFTGWNWPLAVRRLVGLFAFFYGTLHVLCYLVLDQFFDWAAIWEDIWKRPFITAGAVAYLLLVPLAVTSTNKMVKRLGSKRWKRLHRLSYVAAASGVIHFLWRVKADTFEPLIFGAILTGLLAVRFFAWWRDRIRAAAPG